MSCECFVPVSCLYRIIILMFETASFKACATHTGAVIELTVTWVGNVDRQTEQVSFRVLRCAVYVLVIFLVHNVTLTLSDTIVDFCYSFLQIWCFV